MIIDWLSFTVKVEPTTYEQVLYSKAIEGLLRTCKPFTRFALSLQRSQAAGRRPYGVCWRFDDIVLFTGVNLDHALTEISGKGCETLRQQALLNGLISSESAHFTRIDIAQDLADVTPDEIIASGYSRRFRTHSRIAADTGITHYIGSPKSERFARVYRYNEPHPRANLTRIESVHRKRYAQIVVNHIRQHGLIEAGLAAIGSYEFKHAAIPAPGETVLETVTIIKGDQKTLYWLTSQVAPAVRRLIKDGTISDPAAFFAEHFTPKD